MKQLEQNLAGVRAVLRQAELLLPPPTDREESSGLAVPAPESGATGRHGGAGRSALRWPRPSGRER